MKIAAILSEAAAWRHISSSFRMNARTWGGIAPLRIGDPIAMPSAQRPHLSRTERVFQCFWL